MNLINTYFDWYYKKKFVPKDFRVLDEPKVLDAYKDGRNEIYLNFLYSADNNFVSKTIKKVSGPFSHVLFSFYTDDLSQWVTSTFDYNAIRDMFISYYKDKNKAIKFFDKKITKVFGLASAESQGMAYCDYGTYKGRKQVIVKLILTDDEKKKIIKKLCSKKIRTAQYDYVGLFGQLLKKISIRLYKLIFDDRKAFYCSEIVYDILLKLIGLELADNSEPSPTDMLNFIINHKSERYEIVSTIN